MACAGRTQPDRHITLISHGVARRLHSRAATLRPVDAALDPRLIPTEGDWCSCPDAPWFVDGPYTLLDHDETCGFPVSPCSVRAHRITVHKGCGRPMPVRFCGCQPSGYSFDVER